MRFDEAHTLGKDEAKRRIAKLADYWRSKYGVEVSWTEDSARLKGEVKGIGFDAKLTVRESNVEAEGTDPGLLMRSLAKTYLRKKLSLYLDPGVRVEDIIE